MVFNYNIVDYVNKINNQFQLRKIKRIKKTHTNIGILQLIKRNIINVMTNSRI